MVKDGALWTRLAEFSTMYDSTCRYLTALGGDNVTLSDATLAFMKLDHELSNFTTSSYPTLLGNAFDLSLFKNRWKTQRMQQGVKPCHITCLLLDPRPQIRDFVLSEPSVTRSSHDLSIGIIETLDIAVKFLCPYTEDIPDTDEAVKTLVKKNASRNVLIRCVILDSVGNDHSTDVHACAG